MSKFRIGFVVAWYDLWIGLYWNRAKQRLYVLPIPCFGFYVENVRTEHSEIRSQDQVPNGE